MNRSEQATLIKLYFKAMNSYYPEMSASIFIECVKSALPMVKVRTFSDWLFIYDKVTRELNSEITSIG